MIEVGCVEVKLWWRDSNEASFYSIYRCVSCLVCVKFTQGLHIEVRLPILPQYVNPYIMQQLLVSQWHWQANTMPSGWGFSGYGLPYWPIPVCQQWQQDQYYYRVPSSDPASRYYQRSNHRFHMTEPLPTGNIIRESWGRHGEGSKKIVPQAFVRIDPNVNTGVGEVWRAPSKNPLMVDRNLT